MTKSLILQVFSLTLGLFVGELPHVVPPILAVPCGPCSLVPADTTPTSRLTGPAPRAGPEAITCHIPWLRQTTTAGHLTLTRRCRPARSHQTAGQLAQRNAPTRQSLASRLAKRWPGRVAGSPTTLWWRGGKSDHLVSQQALASSMNLHEPRKEEP